MPKGVSHKKQPSKNVNRQFTGQETPVKMQKQKDAEFKFGSSGEIISEHIKSMCEDLNNIFRLFDYLKSHPEDLSLQQYSKIETPITADIVGIIKRNKELFKYKNDVDYFIDTSSRDIFSDLLVETYEVVHSEGVGFSREFCNSVDALTEKKRTFYIEDEIECPNKEHLKKIINSLYCKHVPGFYVAIDNLFDGVKVETDNASKNEKNKQKKEKKAIKANASVTIQKMIRGHLERKKFKENESGLRKELIRRLFKDNEKLKEEIVILKERVFFDPEWKNSGSESDDMGKGYH